jgi:hypothetical protein
MVLIVLGAIVVGVAPLLSWISVPLNADLGLPSSANLFQLFQTGGSSANPAGPIVVAVASYLVALAVLIVLVSRSKATVGGLILSLVTTVSAIAAAVGAVKFYASLDVSLSYVGLGAWVSGVGMLLVLVSSVAYAIAGRRRQRS